MFIICVKWYKSRLCFTATSVHVSWKLQWIESIVKFLRFCKTVDKVQWAYVLKLRFGHKKTVQMKKCSTENTKEPFPAAQWQIEGSSDWIWEEGVRRCWHQDAKLDDNCALYLTSAPKIPFGFKMGAVIKLWKAVVWKYIIYKQRAAKRTQILGPVCFFLPPLIFTSSWVLEKYHNGSRV